MVPPDSTGVSPAPPYSGYSRSQKLTCTGLSPSTARLSKVIPVHFLNRLSRSYNPSQAGTQLVWALPRSLATTCGITIVFFSSRYLDVSVPRVHYIMTCLQHAELSHSEISGSKVMCTSRSLSQLVTSFIASESLGIPHTLLITLILLFF